MNSTKKGWLIAAVSLVIIGLVIVAAVLRMNDWDLRKLNPEEYETSTIAVTERFRDISIQSNTENIRFAASDDGKCRVVFYEPPEERPSAAVQDGTLKITVETSRNWYDRVRIGRFETPAITVYLPGAEYGTLNIQEDTGDIEIPESFRFASLEITASTGDVTAAASTADTARIHTSTGDILVDSISAGNLDLSVSTGKVTVRSVSCAGDLKLHVSTGKAELSDVTCVNFLTDGSTGRLIMENMVAAGKISVERSTGDVRFEKCDAAELYFKMDTGDVKGSLLSGKVFFVQTDTGSVDVPRTTTGGVCEIHTDTGDVQITIA